MKIVYCIPALHWAGGMERVITLKVNYFAEVLGYETYIIITDGKEEKPYFKLSPLIHLINLNVNFNDLYGKPLGLRIVGYLKKQRIYKYKLSEYLKQLKADITISTLRREINFITSINDGSKKIGEIHISKANYRDLKQEKIPNFLQKILGKLWMKQLISKLQKLDQFVVLTKEDQSLWAELKHIKVIPNPLSFYPPKTSNCNTKKVIAVGRYTYEKGFDLLIHSWGKVFIKHPDWKLHIYGVGDKSELAKQVRSSGLSKVCLLESAVPNIDEKYCESSIFVLSSRYEGFGMVIVEAMACGVPPVSFDCPCGPKHIIRNGEDGLLVENGNIEELAEKICYLIEHEDERKRMGKQARINSERFKIEHIAKQWENLFHELLEEKKS